MSPLSPLSPVSPHCQIVAELRSAPPPPVCSLLDYRQALGTCGRAKAALSRPIEQLMSPLCGGPGHLTLLSTDSSSPSSSCSCASAALRFRPLAPCAAAAGADWQANASFLLFIQPPLIALFCPRSLSLWRSSCRGSRSTVGRRAGMAGCRGHPQLRASNLLPARMWCRAYGSGGASLAATPSTQHRYQAPAGQERCQPAGWQQAPPSGNFAGIRGEAGITGNTIDQVGCYSP